MQKNKGPAAVRKVSLPKAVTLSKGIGTRRQPRKLPTEGGYKRHIQKRPVKTGRFQSIQYSASTKHHNRFASHTDQPLLFKGLKHSSSHFTGAAYDASDFLTGNFDLHAIRVCHGIWLLT